MKRKNLLLLFAFSFIFLIGAEQKKEDVLLKETVNQEHKFQLVSVGPSDEVAIGFKYGVVYLYDKDGLFLCGFDFQVNSGASYAVFLNSDSTVDCYKTRSKKICRYNRNGELIEEILITDIDSIDMIKKMRNIDSRGVRYEVKKGNLMKVYPDGKEELFYSLNSHKTDKIAVEIGLLLIAFILFLTRKNPTHKQEVLGK